ncbi:acyl-CoA/acyl-ACP dehydrogenase [Actinoplanes sp. NBC_00393]|uniref:acyl-CoA dehydrogenase family protein n=1 Tax=Actinoplanes sp. NBC_00393 TaxID=2975953 RepID=UPI002E24A983
MRLAPSAEQADLADAVHSLLNSATTWPGLASLGVTGLVVPERWGGLGGTVADLVVVAEELGHHAMPGPVTESIAAVPVLLAGIGSEEVAGKWLPELAAGRAVATMAAPPWLPFAVDAETADLVLFAASGTVRWGVAGAAYPSIDATRRLAEVSPAGMIASGADGAIAQAMNVGALVCAAQLLGAGRALLEKSVAYAGQRTQFGRPIGSFQAVQHRLADVAVGLEFARPLLYAAAASAQDLDVSAAKVACGEAAHRAARAALQVHGAIGYTQEHGLGRWLTRVRALTLAWGTPSQHRARVMTELAKEAQP